LVGYLNYYSNEINLIFYFNLAIIFICQSKEQEFPDRTREFTNRCKEIYCKSPQYAYYLLSNCVEKCCVQFYVECPAKKKV
jgi:hypothetical protein